MTDFRTGEVLLIHKPLKWTSFQVVNKMKWLIQNGERRAGSGEINPSLPTPNSQLTAPHSRLKIGHAGTLDPLATGLLIVCTGKQTKNIESYQAQEKEYTGTFFVCFPVHTIN